MCPVLRALNEMCLFALQPSLSHADATGVAVEETGSSSL